jgi:hypothetical protein
MADDRVIRATIDLMNAINRLANRAEKITDLDELLLLMSTHFKIIF